MSSLRDVAMREIGALRPSPIDTIVIAREFGLGPAWLAPAFAEICTRPGRLTRAEAERLGLHSVLEVGWIREELARRAGNDPPFDVLGAVRASEALMASGQGEARNAGQSMESMAMGQAALRLRLLRHLPLTLLRRLPCLPYLPRPQCLHHL